MAKKKRKKDKKKKEKLVAHEQELVYGGVTELRPARSWTCDACGVDNFMFDVIREFPVEDLTFDMLKLMGIHARVHEQMEEGELLSITLVDELVECHNCQTIYKVSVMTSGCQWKIVHIMGAEEPDWRDRDLGYDEREGA